MHNHNTYRLSESERMKYIRNKWFIYTKYRRTLPIFCLILQNTEDIILTINFLKLTSTEIIH